MFANLLATFVAVAVPVSVLAGSHGHHLLNRHAELAKRVDGDVSLHRRVANSRWSFYETQTGNAGSCGQFLKDSEFIVAMNQAQMNSGWCGKSITMSYGGKTTTASIADTCPGCPYGGLDLSPGLFSFFADQGAGIIYGTWEFAGAAAPAPPAPTTKKTTSTWTPPKTTSTTPKPTPTTTSHSTTPSTTSTSTKASSTSTSSSSKTSSASSSSVNYSSGVASGLAVPTGTVDTTGGVANLADLTQAFVQIGGIIAAGHAL